MGEETIPLRAVGRKAVREIIDGLPERLDLEHMLADRPGRPRLAAEVCGRGEMIGVRMRVEDPGGVQVVLRKMAQERVGRLRRDRP
jgi:hypothetical protein